MRGGASRLPLAALAVASAGPASAWFEGADVGARALGLAHSFVAVADDASAVHWNPAGLAVLRRHELLLAADRSPELAGLRSGFAAVAVHAPGVTFGAGWQHRGLEDAVREDRVYLSAARTLVRRSLGAFVAAGGTLRIAHVGVLAPPGVAGLGSGTAVAADVGLLLAPIPNVTAGAVVRNLGEPTLDVHAGGDRTPLEVEVEWGVSLRWRQDGWVHVSRAHHAFTTTKIGVELHLAGALGVSAGVERDAVAGGLGLGFGPWRLDTAFRAHETLGPAYRMSLRRFFGAERTGLGSEFDEF